MSLSEFCEFSGEAVFCDPEPEFNDYESKYFKAHSLMNEAIRSREFAASLVDQVVPQQIPSVEKLIRPNSLKLPDLSIPIFMGDYKVWPDFRDLFIGAVDRNTSLTGAQKFHYLR